MAGAWSTRLPCIEHRRKETPKPGNFYWTMGQTSMLETAWLHSTYLCVYCERVEFVRMLLEPGVRNGHDNYAGQTPLHFAVKWTWFDGARKIQLVRLLRKTPSQYAEEQEIVNLLLEYGAKSVE